jgi:hypothetical protein
MTRLGIVGKPEVRIMKQSEHSQSVAALKKMIEENDQMQRELRRTIEHLDDRLSQRNGDRHLVMSDGEKLQAN